MMLSLVLCVCSMADAQEVGVYTPYSIFGVGNIMPQGTPYNKAMGGIGIATRNKKVVNYLNPASVTARDSLSFMSDFSLYQNNTLFQQGDINSVRNVCNMNDIVISFPIYRSSAMMIGIAPYSATGYSFMSYVDDDPLISQTGAIAKSSGGSGSIYQLFFGGGVTFWKKLSLGAEYIHYFGHIQKANTVSFSNSTYNGVRSGDDLILKANSAKFGVQYEQPVGNLTMCLGATYSLSAKFKGDIYDYKISTGSIVSDTLRYDSIDPSKARIAAEFGVGASLKSGEKWRAEVNYLRSDWTNSGLDQVTGFANVSALPFSTTASQSFRAGFEYVPNINDVRYYFRRCSYKAGVYHTNEYYKLDGNGVGATGITLGMSFPVNMYYNAISLSIDLGQRGSLANNLIRERYVNFTVGLNAFDIWFQKMTYK